MDVKPREERRETTNMASGSPVDGEAPLSPRENYNPLNEEMEGYDPTFDEEEYEQPNSLGSSQGYDADPFEMYGVTPPQNMRALKRYKERARSQKIKEEKVVLAVDKAIHTKSFSNREQISTFDDVTIKIDNVVDSPVTKKKGSKTFKHARSYERDFKVSSNQPTVDGNQLPPPLPSLIKIDSPNRYLSLNSKHICSASGDDASPVDDVLVKRNFMSTPVECPKDRVDFFKDISRLVNLSHSARKEKREPKHSPMDRQLSSEQELWQNQVNDLIWLELQACMSNRTMEEQDSFLSEAQAQIDAVLQEIMSFRIKSSGAGSSSFQRQGCDKYGRGSSQIFTPEFEENLVVKLPAEGQQGQILLMPSDAETPKEVLRSDWVETRSYDNFTAPVSSQNINSSIEAQKDALTQVLEILNKLESVERLYPTIKALGRAHPIYNSEEFQRRIRTLCAWNNITKELAHKLHLMAKILSIDRMEGINWPWADYECPDKALQRIRNLEDVITPMVECSDDEDGDYEDVTQDDNYIDAKQSPEQTDVSSSNSGEIPPKIRLVESSKNVKFDLNNTSLALSPPGTSTPIKSPTGRGVVLFPRMLSSVSMEELTAQSVYHYFADRMLKKTGLRKMMLTLRKVIYKTLVRAKQGLEKPPEKPSYAAITSQGKETPNISRSNSPNRQDFRSRIPSYGDITFSKPDIDYIGVEDFESMGLPSYKPTYLFLVQIPLDVVHECLRLRLEQKPETEPSLLSVRQLIRECKEVLVGSVNVKKFYHDMVSPVTSDDYILETNVMEAFEEDMKEMLEVYFNYLQTWIFGLQKQPEMSKRLKNALQEEWDFIKDVCPYIRGGEANASNRFCTMASSLLRSISDYLEREMDECINNLYDVTSSVTEDVDTGNLVDCTNSAERRQAIISACRNFKVTFHEARERALKALSFAKMLRKDLEIAAEFNIVTTAKQLLDELEKTGHHQVLAPHSAGYLMFVPNSIAENSVQIVHLLNVTCGREDVSLNNSSANDGYLLLVKCEGCADNLKTCPLWNGPQLKVETTAETTIALSHLEVECLLLVVIHSSQLENQRRQFERLLGNTVHLVSENTSCHQAIADSLQELKMAALDLREKVAYAISQVDEKLNLEDMPEMDEAEKVNLLTLYRETLHQCYNFGFEYHKEVIRLVSGDLRDKMTRVLVDFAKQWIKFVMEKCERGRGVRPRWASQGLDFLTVACNPKTLCSLSEDEYEEVKKMIYAVIRHVVGDKGSTNSPSTSYRVSSPDILLQRTNSIFRNHNSPESRVSRSVSTISLKSQDIHSHPDYGIRKSASVEGQRRVSIQNGEDGGLEMEVFDVDRKGSPSKNGKEEPDSPPSRADRVFTAVQQLEQERTNDLFSRNCIGRVINRQIEVDYSINIRRVNFKWQRGFKIGEGQFGKVYTAINIDNGQMVAMKSIQFQPNDHQTIKNISDEIKRFEGISHPSLVKYYGVEIHRDEMLIFMEYCSEGTIAEVAKLGLPEAMVRKYTSELLVAVNVLHDNGIVHRDIKGANIFLTPSRLKLGDFGCSVQLRSHTTLPGELNNVAGTAAYMAPEVITNSSIKGSGRAADIWSLGCVVIEMVTGKRPWHELETHFMIMFKVGMGGRPSIPDHLSEEGKDFLSHCFESNPSDRWTASQLRDHPFVKVYTEEVPEDSPSSNL